MSRYSARRYIRILFAVFIGLYCFVEYTYDFEITCAIIILYSLILVIDSIQFRIKRHKFIELGEQEHFHEKYLGSLLYIVFLFCFVFFGPKLSALGFLPPIRDEFNTNLTAIVLLPGLITFILRFLFTEKENIVYATEKGILYGLETNEFYFWDDFKSYKHISDQKLLRFERNNSKRLYISYEEKYFNKHREVILTILDKKLTRE